MEKKKVVTREEFERQKTLKIFGSIILASAAAISIYCYTLTGAKEVSAKKLNESYPLTQDTTSKETIKATEHYTMSAKKKESVHEVVQENKTDIDQIKTLEEPKIIPKNITFKEEINVDTKNTKTESNTTNTNESKQEIDSLSEYDLYLKNDQLVYKNEESYIDIGLNQLVAPKESIADKNFSLEVNERNPHKILETLGDEREIYFHTSIMGQKGKKITHNWYYNGKVQFKKTFDVHGDRWRVWTSKKLWNLKNNEVYVLLTDENGKIIDLSVIEK